MKKQYITPESICCEFLDDSFVCLSNINTLSTEEEFAKERSNVSFADGEQDFLMDVDW